MAQRLFERHPGLFEQAIVNGQRIEVHHSGRHRALQSAEAFIAGLHDAQPALAALTEQAMAMPETVYFNDAEGSEDYQRFSDADFRLMQTLDQLANSGQAREMASLLLTPLFSADFLQRLTDGHYVFLAAADADDRIENELDAAEALYGLYSIAPALSQEADLQFGRFMQPQSTAWFAELDDGESFYGRGPSFDDDDITWRGAWALFDDMMARAALAASNDNGLVATVRFSHSQALVPFAVLLGIEGSSEALPPGTLYSYVNSGWRSAVAAPMSANIQWDIYGNDSGELLVRMLHNEGEVRFASECAPLPGTQYFYALSELQRCHAIRRQQWEQVRAYPGDAGP